MEQKWLLVCENYILLDSCMASSKKEAVKIFKRTSKNKDWSESDVISEKNFSILEKTQ